MALRDGARPKPRSTASAATVVVVLVALLVGFEIIARLLDGVGFMPRNFVAEKLSLVASGYPGAYDPALGYVPAPDYDGTPGSWNVRVTVGPRSLRDNAPGRPTPVPAAVVAAGGSYTFGDAVSDAHTWPAQLEGLLDQPVANGGVFGYGLDQAVLRAEMLAVEHRPLALVVGFVYDDVRRTQLVQNAGAEKPYFEVVDGRLELRNVPPSPDRPRVGQLGVVRTLLGYSYLADWIARRADATGWWYGPGFAEVQVHTDGQEVACLLMHRLRSVQESTGARVMVVAQYAARDLATPDDPRSVEDLTGTGRVLECAATAGLIAVDTLPALRARYRAGPTTFVGQYYVRAVPSAAGYRVVAEQVADALARAYGGG
ncbi:hypothetical protein [Thalassobaculum fulvum]|uniref:hypothetical protein n=1 Tax=Thalassobaculum fulvum TaxID=1633335 RepID=UPI001674C101|nr:hypothetical protein [Thalassobaculum fulvum]